jgi:hypothetical protein
MPQFCQTKVAQNLPRSVPPEASSRARVARCRCKQVGTTKSPRRG